jgi:hypothetical protein
VGPQSANVATEVVNSVLNVSIMTSTFRSRAGLEGSAPGTGIVCGGLSNTRDISGTRFRQVQSAEVAGKANRANHDLRCNVFKDEHLC